jgi:hypothetical protein
MPVKLCGKSSMNDERGMRKKGYHFIVKWMKTFSVLEKEKRHRKKIDKHNLVSFLFSHFVSFKSDLSRVLRQWMSEEGRKKEG